MNTLAEPGMRIEPSRQGAVAVLNVTGDVDAANAHLLRDAVIAEIENGLSVVVVDLAQADYIDSVGLGTLVICLKRASEQRTALRLVVTSPQIQKVLQITGLLTVFEIYNSRQTAISGQS